MKDLIKLYSIVLCRTFIFKLQRLIRLCLNGRRYPTKQQREAGTFRDYNILWIAYRYFSVLKVNNNWLTVDFVGPDNNFIFVKNTHGDTIVHNFKELVQTIKINNK